MQYLKLSTRIRNSITEAVLWTSNESESEWTEVYVFPNVYHVYLEVGEIKVSPTSDGTVLATNSWECMSKYFHTGKRIWGIL